MSKIVLCRLSLIILIVFSSFSVNADAASSKVEVKTDSNSSVTSPGLQKLVQTLNKIKTFSGRFVQYSVDQKGSRIQESRGELKADREGLFYWHTEAPLEQVVISDGVQITVYDPDLEQATIQKVGQQAETTPAILFSGDTDKIGELFEVEVKDFGNSISQYLLIPKTKDSLFERLRIRFDGQHLNEMRITDTLGQESTMSFIHTEINLTLPKNTFKPVFPKGTDIIRDIPLSAPQAN